MQSHNAQRTVSWIAFFGYAVLCGLLLMQIFSR